MDIRERRESDLALCLEMAWVIKARDGYPPVGPLDIENFLAPAEQLAAWVAEADSTIVGHIALHAGSDYATGALHGALVTLKDGRVAAHQLVRG